MLLFGGFMLAAINSAGWVLLCSIGATLFLWRVRPFVRYQASARPGPAPESWLLQYKVSIFGREIICEQLAFDHFEVRCREDDGPGFRLYVVTSAGRRRTAMTFVASLFSGPSGAKEFHHFCDAASSAGITVSISIRGAAALAESRGKSEWWVDPALVRLWRAGCAGFASLRRLVTGRGTRTPRPVATGNPRDRIATCQYQHRQCGKWSSSMAA